MEIRKLDYHRLHGASYDDRNRFAFDYLSSWIHDAKLLRERHPEIEIYQYNTVTMDVLEDLYQIVTEDRPDITKENCAPGDLQMYHGPEIKYLSKVQRHLWCGDFAPYWNETIWGPCEI